MGIIPGTVWAGVTRDIWYEIVTGGKKGGQL